MPANIAQPSRPQQRIANRMGQNIGIGMPQQSFFKRDLHTGQNQFSSLDQSVNVVTNSNQDTHRFQPSISLRIISARAKSDLRVILTFWAVPSTTATVAPSRSTRAASSVASKFVSAALRWASRKRSILKACGVWAR